MNGKRKTRGEPNLSPPSAPKHISPWRRNFWAPVRCPRLELYLINQVFFHSSYRKCLLGRPAACAFLPPEREHSLWLVVSALREEEEEDCLWRHVCGGSVQL